MNASYRSSKQVPTRVWRIVMVLALAGCSPNSGWAGLEGMEPDAGLDQVSLPLIAGEVTYERPEVGRWGGCTATLVAADAIVLAAHCRGYGSRRGPGNYGYFYIRTSSRQSHRYVVDRYR